jgi:hypothetical protein
MHGAPWLGSILLALVLVADIACDSDDTAQTLRVTPAPATSTATTATSGGTPAAASSTSPTPQPATSDLTKALLALEDMPAGWSLAPQRSPSGSTPCGQPLPRFSEEAIESKSVEFERAPTVGPSITHTIARFPSGMAQRVIDRWRQILEQCPQWEEPANQGTTYQLRAAPLSFPRLGDQTFAVRLTVAGGGAAAQGDQVIIRRGDVLSVLTATTAGLGAAAPFDAALLEQLARKADEKLGALR